MKHNSDLWQTPPELFNKLAEEFLFYIDAACTKSSQLCWLRYTEEDNALEQDWYKDSDNGRRWIWLNPPYSRGNIGKFMKKVAEEQAKGARIVTLTRLDPSTKWWKKYIDGCASEVRMLRSRPHFLHPTHPDSGKGYNFPCAVSIFPAKFTGNTLYKLWSY